MAVLIASQISGSRLGGVAVGAPRSRLAPAHAPAPRRARAPLPVRAVAMPSGAGPSKPVAAAAPAAGASKLKQLITPFSDPAANSKMLALASGESLAISLKRWYACFCTPLSGFPSPLTGFQ